MKTKMIVEEVKEFHTICRHIICSCNNEYAKSYAHAGRHMKSVEEIQIQILYIQNNLQYWRGDDARKTKAKLKALQ